jgi:flagellar basal-body rod modification protein FlgD
MATSGVGGTAANASLDALRDTMNPAAAEKKSTAVEAQDRFMKLLITQMKNQDPLSPMDNAQVTSQLAQLSTVTGIDKLNETMASMSASYQAQQTVQASALINHGVLAPGNNVVLADKQAQLGFDLSGTAQNVTVNIKKPSGEVVATLDYGAAGTGTTPLSWDGKDNDGKQLPDGVYKFDVVATTNGVERMTKDKDGKEVKAATALAFGIVNSVSTNATGIKLNASGFSQPLNMSDVREIL